MDKKLFASAVAKFILGIVLTGLPIFISSGTIYNHNGWLFIGLLFIPMLIAGIVLMIRNPELLKKRLNVKEKESQQKYVILFSGIMFLAGFVLAGLDYRFQWTVLPKWLVVAGAVVFIVAYILYAEVLRENVYLSRTVEVQKNQKVIDTGLYGIVRHPMYMSTLFLFLSIPIVLGSGVSFLVFLFYPLIIAKRIRNEEKVLEKGLEGYIEYKKKVKYQVIPFIW